MKLAQVKVHPLQIWLLSLFLVVHVFSWWVMEQKVLKTIAAASLVYVCLPKTRNLFKMEKDVQQQQLGEPSEWTSLYELSSRITYCWTSFSISDRKLGPSGRSRQHGWRCIIGHTLLRMVRWCNQPTRLTLICEVIRYRLVQVRQNLKKKNMNRVRVGRFSYFGSWAKT